MANLVKLTFAGEEKPLTDSFDRVGDSAKHMSDKVGDAGSGFDRAGEAADVGERRAQGFSDTLTGTADVASGTALVMKGDLFEGFTTIGGGLADLAGGFADLLIPAISKATTAFKASAIGQRAAAVASKIWAAAQWIMNSAMWASPITWIIAGVIALVAIIVLIAKKTDWFSRGWKVAWGWIKQAASNTWDFLKKIPGWIGTAFGKIAQTISWPYRKAFNLIADAWNNTIGRLHWSVPDWVPLIGGKSISVPNLPHFHAGGIVPGVVGTQVPIMAQAGERIGSIASRGGDGGGWVPIRGDAVIDALVQAIASRVDAKGGRAAQLGIRFRTA